jgi:hypothetical protein
VADGDRIPVSVVHHIKAFLHLTKEIFVAITEKLLADRA